MLFSLLTIAATAFARPALPPSLTYLQLTPQEVSQREKNLAPLYNDYATTNVAKLAGALEDNYKINVYHHVVGGDWTAEALNSKAGIMAAAVQYAIRDNQIRDDEGSTSLYASYGFKAGFLFDRISPVELGFKGRILLDDLMPSDLSFYSGDAKHAGRPLANSPFSITSEVMMNSYVAMSGWDPAKILSLGLVKHPFGGFDTNSFTLFTSESLLGVERPAIKRFLFALRDKQIRALDATVVFVNTHRLRVVDTDSTGHLFAPMAPYAVVYPGFSRVAPIPQPIIFISEDATDADLAQMIDTEAPLIFAYNKLFDMQIMPGEAQFEASLAKVSSQSPLVANLVRQVGSANAREASRRAFLSLAYGVLTTGAAPVQIGKAGAMLAANTVATAATFVYNNVASVANGIYDIMTTPSYNETVEFNINQEATAIAVSNTYIGW